MYNIGDLVFYGKTGVCRVEEITKMSSAAFSEDQDYYILKPMYQECKISIPVNNKSIFIRPIATREEVLAMIDQIPGINAEAFYCHNLNQLKEHYREIMATHDCMRMIELTISVYNKRREAIANKKKLGAVDERFMKEAEELVYGEFAAALEMPKDEVIELIRSRLKEN